MFPTYQEIPIVVSLLPIQIQLSEEYIARNEVRLAQNTLEAVDYYHNRITSAWMMTKMKCGQVFKLAD